MPTVLAFEFRSGSLFRQALQAADEATTARYGAQGYSGASAPPGTLEAVERVGELAADLLSGEALDR